MFSACGCAQSAAAQEVEVSDPSLSKEPTGSTEPGSRRGGKSSSSVAGSKTLLAGKTRGKPVAPREARPQVTYAHKWAEAVATYGTLDALVFDGEGPEIHFSYQDLEASANRLSRGLRDLGIKPGDMIATISENRPEMVALVLSSIKLGVTFVPLPSDLRPQDLNTMVERYKPALIVCDQPQYMPFKRGDDSEYRTIFLPPYGKDGNELARMMSEGSEAPVEIASHPEGTASVIFSTSGSTAAPKGVMYSADHLLVLTTWGGDIFNGAFDARTQRLVAVKKALGSSAFGTRFLQSVNLRTKHLMWLPMRGVGGTMLMLKHLLEGALTVMVDTYPSGPELWAKLIDKHSINSHILFGAAMNQTLQEMPGRTFPTIRAIAYGGCCFAPTLLQKSMEQFPSALYIQVYGMTEVHPISLLAPQYCKRLGSGASEEDMARMASAGIPANPEDVFIEDLDQPGSGKPPPPEKDGVGQICARATVTMMGYYAQPEKTKETIPDGEFVRTGDVGKFDKDGFLYILGRAKDIIPAYKGFNVAPRDIEEILYAHPNVGQAAVCGVWHPSGAGEAVVAWAKAKSGGTLTADGLRKHCQDSGMPTWQMPDAIYVVQQSLPTVSNKVDSKSLRAGEWRQAALADSLLRASASVDKLSVAPSQADEEALLSELSGTGAPGALGCPQLQMVFGDAMPRIREALPAHAGAAELRAMMESMPAEERASFLLGARSLLGSWAAGKV